MSRCACTVDLYLSLGKVLFDLEQCGYSQISKRGLKLDTTVQPALTDAADFQKVHGRCYFPVLHAVTRKLVNGSAVPKGVVMSLSPNSFFFRALFVISFGFGVFVCVCLFPYCEHLRLLRCDV